MKKRKKNNYFIKIALAIILFLIPMSIGYSLMTDTLHINGQANIKIVTPPGCNITINNSILDSRDGSKTITITYELENITESKCQYEYSIDGGTTWNIYTGPFKIYETKNIKARCLTKPNMTELAITEKTVTITYAQLKVFSGFTSVMGFTGLNKSDIIHIKRASNDITLEDILNRINNGEDIQRLDDLTGNDYVVYGWYDNNGTFYWWSNCDVIYFAYNTNQAFRDFNNLESIDLTGLDTSKIASFHSWFWQDYKLKDIDISNFNTSKVTTLYGMFYRCYSIESYDFSKWDTSNVTNFASMFGWNNSITSLDLSSFNTSKATNMNDMFNVMEKLTELNISSFDTSKVTSMYRMFASCHVLETLDVSSFNTSSLVASSNMFSDCEKLKTIYASDEFVVSQITDSTKMFYNSTEIVGGNGTTYNDGIVDKTYARIDTAENPGYFTSKN